MIPEWCSPKDSVTFSFGCSLDRGDGLAVRFTTRQYDFVDKQAKRDAQLVESWSDRADSFQVV